MYERRKISVYFKRVKISFWIVSINTQWEKIMHQNLFVLKGKNISTLHLKLMTTESILE